MIRQEKDFFKIAWVVIFSFLILCSKGIFQYIIILNLDIIWKFEIDDKSCYIVFAKRNKSLSLYEIE